MAMPPMTNPAEHPIWPCPRVDGVQRLSDEAQAERRRGQRRRGLPVREIGEVMFADGCRQSFAEGRGQALPFFQRRVIRQRDGKKYADF